MLLSFVPKEPHLAYVSNQLWLPKSKVRQEPIKMALEFEVPSYSEGPQKLKLWEETTHHLICPREFIPVEQYTNYQFPFVDLSPQFERVEFKDNTVLRDESQEKAWPYLLKNSNGIFNLACGHGKTRLALKKAASMGVPTLVIVPDGGILSQWKETILGDWTRDMAPAIEFKGGLGIVQGDENDWNHPLTLALVTTLALRLKKEKLEEEFKRRWGLIVFDECHQMAAPVFSLTAKAFYGNRLGLTATVTREDGLDPIYRFHMGEPFYSDLSQELNPKIYFQATPTRLNLDEAEVNGLTHMSVLRVNLGRDFNGNVYRYWSIKAALESGRKLLCLSHSVDQLKLFHAMFPESGLIIGSVPKETRMKILRSSQICFAIASKGSTGVDDDRLDTAFWLTPFRSKISLQQSMGRLQRPLPGKKDPMFIVFDDREVDPLRGLCYKLRHTLKDWRYDFVNLPLVAHPLNLPEDVKKRYDQAFAELPLREKAIEEMKHAD